MRKRLLIHCSILLGLLLCLPAQAVVDWGGINIVADVTDEDINMSGINTFMGGIRVAAETSDVTITPTADTILQGQAAGASEFYLYAAVGRTITLDLRNNVTFYGSDDPGMTDLLVTWSGEGDLDVILWDNKKVSFTSMAARGGTKFYIRMNPNDSNVLFYRNTISSANDVEVEVGPKSLISYIAPTAVSTGTANEVGAIAFAPDNAVGQTGRLILRIKDTGGFYIGGSQVADVARPVLGDIDMTVPAGLEARFIVANAVGATHHSGLFVLNENKTFSYPLLNIWNLPVNPFYADQGVRYGFILGANALLRTQDESYLDYVGLANNICVEPPIPNDVLMGADVTSLVKERNTSAFVVDGNANLNATPAEIQMNGNSGIYFRSGVDRDGNVDPDSFLVDPINFTPGAGEFVFDVEGQLEVNLNDGGTAENAFQILSLQVNPSGPLGFILYNTTRTNFPSRTFAKDVNNVYYVYNKGAFLVNNRINFRDTWLVHTDSNHSVCENNDCTSEPTYVGGDTINFQFEDPVPVFIGRPKMAFYDSYFYVHTSVAVTGVDLFVPNGSEGNNSEFKFFGNGFKLDDSSGRNMILGTSIGATACDGCTIIDGTADDNGKGTDAHLDVFQENISALDPHELRLTTSCNNDKIIEGGIDYACGTCPDEPSTQTIYLGHASNITIGSMLPFINPTHPQITIAGEVFSFATRGGTDCTPSLSGVTGEGGIFVDLEGTITIDSCFRANVSTMIVISTNSSVVDLPKSQVFFNSNVAISDWQLDLTTKTLLVPAGQSLSDYTLYWIETIKDYDTFCPYLVGGSPSNCCCADCCGTYTCACPPVTEKNVSGIPVVSGEVDQFQIYNSTISLPAHLRVFGGNIRELVFLKGCNSAEAPTAVLVMEEGAIVGLGSNHKNVDALFGSIFLGVNGITIIANGNSGNDDTSGEILLNEDVIINNSCHIVKGPDFEDDGILRFTSDVPREIVVKSGGSLNLTTFTEDDQTVEIGGYITLVLEPGAKVILGGGTLKFADHAIVRYPSITDLDVFEGADSVAVTDPFRVKFIGDGYVVLADKAKMLIEEFAYVGVESADCFPQTDLRFILQDEAEIKIGGDELKGGVFQIGNTSEEVEDGSVLFGLALDNNSKFTIGNHSMFGLGIGIVDNRGPTLNDWKVDGLRQVEDIAINIVSGTFSHERTFAGNDSRASLLAIQDADEDIDYTFVFDPIQASILGGGNLELIGSTTASAPIAPEILTTDGEINDRLSVGIMSSKMFLHDIFGVHKTDLPTDSTGAELFAYLKIATVAQGCRNCLATAALDGHNQTVLGYIDYVDGVNDYIVRPIVDSIFGRSGKILDNEHSVEIGTVGVGLGYGAAPRPLVRAFELP